ncbi:MAG: hypothetical protein HZA90_21505 [Verrucomicrobia bacterium]|nr:hypothetical protein [Verrucomicrobiota bacterium]
MNYDELQQAWQAQPSRVRVSLDADVLLQEVRRNQRHFTSVLFWRDLREVGGSLLMVPVWIWIGVKEALPWAWYLGVPALLWIAGFMMVDRMRQKRRQPKAGDPLRECVEGSLAQVEHQIWLLRNVTWWCLLPVAAAVGTFFAHCAWLARDAGWLVELIMAGITAVAAAILWGVYRLNQNGVRKDLEPRRQELVALLRSLQSN